MTSGGPTIGPRLDHLAGAHHYDGELANLGAQVYGLSTQTTEYQQENDRASAPAVLAVERFALRLGGVLPLPTSEVEDAAERAPHPGQPPAPQVARGPMSQKGSQNIRVIGPFALARRDD